MVKVSVTKYPGFGFWFFNMRYMAVYKGYYCSSNSERRAIKKALKRAGVGRPKSYCVEVPVEAK